MFSGKFSPLTETKKCRWKARNPHQGDCTILTFNATMQNHTALYFGVWIRNRMSPVGKCWLFSLSQLYHELWVWCGAFQTRQIAHPKKAVQHWVLKAVIISPNNLWGIKQYWMCCVNKRATFVGICPSIWAAPCGFNIHIHYTLVKGELNSFHSFTKVATLVSHTL